VSLLAPAEARRFMATYEQVAIGVHGVLTASPSAEPSQALAEARKLLQETPELLNQAIQFLRERGTHPDPEVIEALSQMRLAEWVHLKDLKSGAILLDIEGHEAYCVTGLTQSPGEIIGSRGWLVETALCPFTGVILCDGIFLARCQLGPNLRRRFNERYLGLKAAGRLHRRPDTAPLWESTRSGR
jgi:hypothetical protein